MAPNRAPYRPTGHPSRRPLPNDPPPNGFPPDGFPPDGFPPKDPLPKAPRPKRSPPKGRPPPTRYRPWTPATITGISSFFLPTFSLIQLYYTQNRKGFAIYTLGVSTVSFLQYGYDKMQARNQDWRVAESALHFVALIGGWPGALLGMHYFQHKTSKVPFQIRTWLIVTAWQGLWWFICKENMMFQFDWLKSATGDESRSPAPAPSWRLFAR